MICSACQQDNEPGTQLCIRCDVHRERNLPPQLVLESLFTNEFIWGINVGGLAVPLVLLASGVLGAWLIWDRVGFSSYWTITGFAALMPAFRRGQFFNGIGSIRLIRSCSGRATGLGPGYIRLQQEFWLRLDRRHQQTGHRYVTAWVDGDIITYRLNSLPITPH